MASHIQVFNPVPNQKVKKTKLNVMGRIHGGKIPTLGVYLNNFMIRRVNPSRTGAFECHLDLGELPNGEHQVEIRAIFAHGTERVIVNFIRLVAQPPKSEEDDGAPSNPDE